MMSELEMRAGGGGEARRRRGKLMTAVGKYLKRKSREESEKISNDSSIFSRSEFFK